MLKTITGNDSGNATVDCKALPNYQKLTKDNFIIEVLGIQSILGTTVAGKTSYKASGASVVKSYSNGILTISGLTQTIGTLNSDGSWANTTQQGISAKVYLVI